MVFKIVKQTNVIISILKENYVILVPILLRNSFKREKKVVMKTL